MRFFPLGKLLILGSILAASQLSALEVPLSVASRGGLALPQLPVTGGVPFARGAVRDLGQLRLLSGGREIPAQFLATAKWPDGSIRWALVDTEVDLPAYGAATLLLTSGTPAPFAGINVTESTDTITVDTGAGIHTIRRSELSVRGAQFSINSAANELLLAVPNTWVIEEKGPMKVVLRADGHFFGAGPITEMYLVRFRARLTFYRNRPETRVALTFQNNAGFNWQGSMVRGPVVGLGSSSFGGLALLPRREESYKFGQGVEKTWHTVVPAAGQPELAETRFRADGTLASGYTSPAPILTAAPAYYAATRAWGAIGLPVRGAGERQPEFDAYERQQLAMVSPAALQAMPGWAGVTIWGHLATDLQSWNDYGDLRWAGSGCGTFSGNHYDWSYGMYLQFMRTGRLEFADAARVFAQHEVDFDIYHTNSDAPAFNYQKNWEDRPSHDTPDNCFGPGRPTHTWTQGYALHWLLTGDRRGLDAFNELQEGVRQYLYEGFVDDGRVDTDEIRTNGWILENLVTRWRIEPDALLENTNAGSKRLPEAMKDVLYNVFKREAAAGGKGFVYSTTFDDREPDPNLRSPLQIAYFLEPAIKAADEVFRDSDPPYAASLTSLVQRMTGFLMSVTYGGDTNERGFYRPRQIPYRMDIRDAIDTQKQGQIPYLLMSANAAGFVYSQTNDTKYRDYARAAFADYVRYYGIIPGDTYEDPAVRTPAAYSSPVFPQTESKVQGWGARYGQYFLATEVTAEVPPPAQPVPSRRRAVRRGR